MDKILSCWPNFKSVSKSFKRICSESFALSPFSLGLKLQLMADNRISLSISLFIRILHDQKVLKADGMFGKNQRASMLNFRGLIHPLSTFLSLHNGSDYA